MLQLIAAILVAAPELIIDVERLIADLKSGNHTTPITPEIIMAMAPLFARLQPKQPAPAATGATFTP
jgi:hypothetical protein